MLINQDYVVLYPIVQKTSTYMSDNSMEFRENLGRGGSQMIRLGTTSTTVLSSAFFFLFLFALISIGLLK